jgi:hypothetical protein
MEVIPLVLVQGFKFLPCSVPMPVPQLFFVEIPIGKDERDESFIVTRVDPLGLVVRTGLVLSRSPSSRLLIV